MRIVIVAGRTGHVRAAGQIEKMRSKVGTRGQGQDVVEGDGSVHISCRLCKCQEICEQYEWEIRVHSSAIYVFRISVEDGLAAKCVVTGTCGSRRNESNHRPSHFFLFPKPGSPPEKSKGECFRVHAVEFVKNQPKGEFPIKIDRGFSNFRSKLIACLLGHDHDSHNCNGTIVRKERTKREHQLC